jgi:HAD superfamily hydrolase (TIGR01509 family)
VHAASVALDRGEIDVNEFFRRLGEVTNQLPDEVEAEFGRHTSVNDELVELVGELAKDYRIGLLSNADSVFIRAILAEHDLERLGMAKPDAEIFQHILTQLGVAPAQAIFIDDNAKNTAAAERAGIRGVVYTDMPALQADLAALGIKPS